MAGLLIEEARDLELSQSDILPKGEPALRIRTGD
jgi:hypothetical protein